MGFIIIVIIIIKYINGVLKIEGRPRPLDRGGVPAIACPGRELTIFT